MVVGGLVPRRRRTLRLARSPPPPSPPSPSLPRSPPRPQRQPSPAAPLSLSLSPSMKKKKQKSAVGSTAPDSDAGLDLKSLIHQHSVFFDKLIELIPAKFYLPSDDKDKPWFQGF
ncbi:hypothetical protein NL676_023219 [Syzygium grande]|nr:hypothetical protein NL676_023219 [Syzygium grande]